MASWTRITNAQPKEVHGIKSDDYSFGYVAAWSGGGADAVAAIKASGTRIQRAAESIVAGLDDLRAERLAA